MIHSLHELRKYLRTNDLREPHIRKYALISKHGLANSFPRHRRRILAGTFRSFFVLSLLSDRN